MHACKIRLSAAVLQVCDGSGLGGTLSSSACCLQSTQPISGEETATWDDFNSIHSQQEDVEEERDCWRTCTAFRSGRLLQEGRQSKTSDIISIFSTIVIIDFFNWYIIHTINIEREEGGRVCADSVHECRFFAQ